ncbi:hypothetical protein [Dysgonomonas sp. HGC4]|uniref:hypothetical protein n=1 Tax=Dysgonomonas sp. HGC4 TaxID=1658009 RepID=UPI0006831AEF|nr:hypothetical protein [Dysgonomonas sp. HGC4]MBD8349380.1 hypothetical protein [Dysgonomonas sp. HGC4]
MKKLLKEISEFCFENDVKINKIELLAGYPSSYDLNDFYAEISSMDEEEINRAFKYAEITYQLREFEDTDDFYDWLYSNELYGFFVELHFRIFDNYKFDKDGNFKSCLSTAMSHLDFYYAPDLETLFKIIKARSVYYGDIDCEKSKSEQLKNKEL